MVISLLLVSIIALGGFAVTYLMTDDEPLMWRLAAGNVIGSAVFGTLAFVASMVAGFSAALLVVCALLWLLPLVVFRNKSTAELLSRDRKAAGDKLRGADVRKLLRFAYYAFWLLLFVFFFMRAMIETPQGIFTGGSQNLGDLPFHLGAIFGFTDGGNFPPQNPSFAGARFSYPFIADFLTASFMRLGAGTADAMFVQNVSWAFSLLVMLERFVVRLTGDRLAGRIGPALLFFSGGLGFFAFFTDFWAQAKPLTEFLWHMPVDYTIGERFRWGNSMVVMFLTQRSILIGMPLTIAILGILWREFAPDGSDLIERPALSVGGFPLRLFVAGLFAGLLPLIHLHSLAVLFVVGVFLFVLQPQKWKAWAAFAAGTAALAIPELVWSLSGTASETGKFLGWHFGWNKADNETFLWFWLMNTGIFIPVAAIGLYLISRRPGASETTGDSSPVHHNALLFYLPFAFLFFVSNVAKLAPWEWDNIKVLVYWFAGSIPFAAYALSWIWHRSPLLKAAAALCFAVLILSGALDVWRTASAQINYKVFERDAVVLAERVKQSTEPDALFLNAPTYNTAVVLTGRRSLMRYVGHLSSHGIDYGRREADVKRMYQGGPDAERLISEYQIQYVLISPEERNSMAVNEPYFMKFPVVAEAGQYRVYKIR